MFLGDGDHQHFLPLSYCSVSIIYKGDGFVFQLLYRDVKWATRHPHLKMTHQGMTLIHRAALNQLTGYLKYHLKIVDGCPLFSVDRTETLPMGDVLRIIDLTSHYIMSTIIIMAVLTPLPAKLCCNKSKRKSQWKIIIVSSNYKKSFN